MRDIKKNIIIFILFKSTIIPDAMANLPESFGNLTNLIDINFKGNPITYSLQSLG